MNRLALILALLAFMLIVHSGVSQQIQNDTIPPYVSDDQILLENLTKKARRNLFVMLKTGQEVLAVSGPNEQATEQARILVDGTEVYSARYDSTSLIEYVNRDERYTVLEQQPGFIRIQLSPEKEGWIKAHAAFVSSLPTNKPNLISSLSNNSLKQVEVIHRLYNAIEQLEKVFVKAYDKIAYPTAKAKATQQEFRRHISNARVYYQTYFAGITISPAKFNQKENRLSGTVTISGGTSVFTDKYSESLKEEFKGSLRDIAIGGVYRIDQTSSVNLLVNTRSEVLQTPFKNNNYQLGYRKQTAKTNLLASVGLNQYKDDFRGINSYDRLLFSARLVQKLNHNNRVIANYQFIQNNYDAESTSDYTRHHLSAGTESILKNNNVFLFNLRADLSASTREQLNFLHLLPSITYRKRQQEGTTDYLFSYETFSYDSLQLRNSKRGTFGIASRKREGLGSTKNNEFLLSYILYEGNNTIDHLRMSIRSSKNSVVGKSSFSTFGLTGKYFTNNIAASYVDIRYDVGTNNKTYSQFAFFDRIYYPGETALMLLEANFKLGFKAWDFRMGPVLSIRGTINFDDFNLEADGNYFRLGAFLEGTKVYRSGLQFSLNAAYDYGNVFSEEIVVDPDSGLITYGEGSSRNPTTFRISFQASYPVVKLFDVFLNFDHYKIDRDFELVSGLNPILSSNRLSIKAGFVYRYN